MPEILFPPGRMIGGDLDKLFPVTEDDGKTPKLDKAGQPMMECSIGYAIPKQGEQHWAHTDWGRIIYETGAAAHPNLVASPAFSWKVTDGDSQIPNKKGKKPCEKVGHPGHWVLWFKQGWLPKKVNSDGTVALPDGAIVPGYYIQLYGSVAGNKLVTNGTPGVYLNPIAVALVGEGDRIATDVDTTAVGFGAAPLPAGARPVSPIVPGMPPMGAPPVPPLPGMPAVPPMPAAPPAAPAHVMLPAAQGQTYEAMIAQGWTDALLIQHNMMQAPAPAPTLPAAPPMPPTPPAPVAPPVPPVGAPPVAPNMAALTPPVAPGGIPAAPPVPPVAPAAPVMTAKAAGVPYATFIAQGWNDDQLRAQGYMQ